MPYWFDGNNLIGQSAEAARKDPKRRRAFLELLSAYAIARGGRFLVFFDGDDSDRSMPPRGVRVRYSAPLSTDDALLHFAEGAKAPSEIIVVTNDLALASRCRNVGTKVMDWGKFTAKMEASPRVGAKQELKEEKIDLQEWSKYFGVDPENLE